MTKAVWGTGIRLAGAAGPGLASISCGTQAREGTSSSYLIVNGIEAASGADPTTFGTVLFSDVVTVKDGTNTIFADPARVHFLLGLKDPGPASSPTSPTQSNFITVN